MDVGRFTVPENDLASTFFLRLVPVVAVVYSYSQGLIVSWFTAFYTIFNKYSTHLVAPPFHASSNVALMYVTCIFLFS